MAFKKLLLTVLTATLLTSCVSTDNFDKAITAIENELPGIADKTKEVIEDMPQLIDKAKEYAYDSISYDTIKRFENEIKKQTAAQITANNGNADIDLSALKDVIDKANMLKLQYTNEYNTSTDAEQVKEIERTVTIELTNASKFNLAKDLATADVDTIIVKSGNIEVAFSPKMLAKEFIENDSINVAVTEDNGTYKVAFEDNSGKKIKLNNNVTVSIESSKLKKDSVIYNLQDGIKELIGGKVEDGALTFQTKSGGVFSPEVNKANFNDISDIDKPTQEAIKVLASKGVFSTDMEQFNPEKTVSRAEAVTMITKTLYKYDPDYTAAFDDVADTDWFYTAVASGAAEAIVNGYPDNTFRPGNIISKQELLTIAANTLISDRKFLLPEDESVYLGDYEEEISQWARPYVSMTIRDGIIDQGYAVKGEGEITRAEAALILYNLFEKL